METRSNLIMTNIKTRGGKQRKGRSPAENIFRTYEYSGNNFNRDMNTLAANPETEDFFMKQRRKDVPEKVRAELCWWAPMKWRGSSVMSDPVPDEEELQLEGTSSCHGSSLDGCMMDGEIIGSVIDSFYEAGAKNVQIVTAVTKKNRPSYMIFVDAREKDADAIEQVIVEECGSSGWHRIETCHRYTNVSILKKILPYVLPMPPMNFR